MTVLRLSEADRSRRNKLAGMLGSAFDGERLNALGLLQKMADSYKVPIHELLLAGSSHEAQHARAHPAAAPDPEMPDLPPDWREAFAAIGPSTARLTSWERNFVSDLIARGTRWPSPKQALVIIRILEKTAADANADWEDG